MKPVEKPEDGLRGSDYSDEHLPTPGPYAHAAMHYEPSCKEGGMETVTTLERRIKRLITYLIALPLACVLIVLLYEDAKSRFGPRLAAEAAPLNVGSLAPDFSFPDLDGNMVMLSNLRGRVVFINIWATWCPTCVWEMPHMEYLYRQFKDQNFVMLAVSIDILGKDVVAPFMEKHRLTFPALLDPMGTIKRLYRATGVPETFIVDKRGILAHKEIGARDWTTPSSIAMIRQLVDEKVEPRLVAGSRTRGDRLRANESRE